MEIKVSQFPKNLVLCGIILDIFEKPCDVVDQYS